MLTDLATAYRIVYYTYYNIVRCELYEVKVYEKPTISEHHTQSGDSLMHSEQVPCAWHRLLKSSSTIAPTSPGKEQPVYLEPRRKYTLELSIVF